MPPLAVITSTYNRPDALAAALEGYAAQRDRDYLLVVADDGSTDETRRLIESFAARVPVPVRHVWHEDTGFALSAIRNRAVAACPEAEYLIFTDGDCIPAPTFVAGHRRLAEPGWFLAGQRLLLSEAFTRKVLNEGLPVQDWPLARWIAASLRGDCNRWLPLLALPDGAWRRRQAGKLGGIRGCNISLWRDDLVRINGFDEAYQGWGLEDSDLVVRLFHAGVRRKSARFAAPLFHLWHPENDRSAMPENQRRLEELIASDRVRATLGLDRYPQR